MNISTPTKFIPKYHAFHNSDKIAGMSNQNCDKVYRLFTGDLHGHLQGFQDLKLKVLSPTLTEA